jgi:Tfp pilus assembly protein FimT
MITLFIFAIITMFGVPAFYNFIEQSRAQSQMIKAANFLRSAQEIATSTNRIVYVYTAGYFDYDHQRDQDSYWYQDWIMSFKPIGYKHTTIVEQDKALRVEDAGKITANPNYLITQQQVFTSNNTFHLNVLDSKEHNAIDRKKISGSNVNTEMEGYSKVREAPDQGSVVGKPTYLVFYPSGALIMPIFVLDENTVDESFSSAKNWGNIKGNFKDPIGILAGCRIGGGLTIDVINYTFNKEIIQNDLTFTPTIVNGTSGSPPSFSQNICGSRFLQ